MEEVLFYLICIVIWIMPMFLKIFERKKEIDDELKIKTEIAKNLSECKDIPLSLVEKYRVRDCSKNNDENDNELKALVCPNCGAALKAIYIRCEYCGLSYCEAKKKLEKESNDENI